MAIDYVRNIISSGYNLSKINDNFVKIEEALQDGLSRSGNGPNQMSADLDMNGNDILNIHTLQVSDLTIDGTDPTGILERALDAVTETAASATNAALSATNAATSAAEAALSATNAATSAAEAAASVASINLPTIGAGDAGLLVAVNGTEDGYEFVPPPIGGLTSIATRTELAALPVDVDLAFLDEGVRTGIFRKVLISSLSATSQTAVAADTLGGIYVVSSNDPNYVWVRDRPNSQIYDVRWFGVVSDDSSAAAANSAALAVINNMVENRKGTILLPLGLIHIASTFTTDKVISWQGVDKAASGLYAVGFVGDQSILNYDGLTNGLGIHNMSVRNCAFWSDNNLARVATMRGVVKSTWEDLYFYQVYRGIYGEKMWSHNFKNVSAFSVTTEMFLLDDECNNIHFDRVEFRGQTGIKVIGNCAGLTFNQCDIEGITGEGGAGIHLAPATGKTVRGVHINSYFEKVESVGIRCDGADAGSVQGLFIGGSYFFGGSTSYFSGSATKAQFAVVLHNVKGFQVNANSMLDWRYAIFIDETALHGEIKYNPEVSLSQGFILGTPPASVTVVRANT